VESMAFQLQHPLVTVACHEDLTATDPVARHLLVTGSTESVDGPLTTAVRTGRAAGHDHCSLFPL
jgi:nitric oxide reductase NorQ protein